MALSSDDKKALIGIPFILGVGLFFAWAGSDGFRDAKGGLGHPFAVGVCVAFAMQWVAFLPSYIKQTEKYFDLVGSVTYLTVVSFAYLASGGGSGRPLLLWILVMVWALRLGFFLFRRIHKAGKDGRFDEMKTSFPRFLAAWTLQGLWVSFTVAAAMAAITSPTARGLDGFAWLGLAVWLLGFGIEALADAQKARFRRENPDGSDFISRGLWSRSRHPNYFGEIVLWVGVAIIAYPSLEGWQLLTLSAPAFVTLLLLKVSGVPMLEKRADEKWGGQEDYERYKRETPVLFPRLF